MTNTDAWGLKDLLADMREAWEILKGSLKRTEETLEQMAATLKQCREPYIEIEEENYTIRLPLRLVTYRYYDPRWAESWTLRNFHPPRRWKVKQDKRKRSFPLGRSAYLQKAKKENRLARSTYTQKAPQKGATREEQCKHTFKITVARCAPCSGYDKTCKHYRPKKQ